MESRQKSGLTLKHPRCAETGLSLNESGRAARQALETFIKESDNELAELADKLLKPVRRTRMPAKSAGEEAEMKR